MPSLYFYILAELLLDMLLKVASSCNVVTEIFQAIRYVEKLLNDLDVTCDFPLNPELENMLYFIVQFQNLHQIWFLEHFSRWVIHT